MAKLNPANPQNIVKGLLITGVVYFHSSFLIDPVVRGAFNPLLCFFPFLMGVFFFYAGYNFVPGKRIERGERQRKKARFRALSSIWRRNRDSNPSALLQAYELSKPAPSTTWVFLQI